MEEELKTVQQRIRYLFDRSRMTQKEFAKTVGIGQAHLSGIMTNRNPSRLLMAVIAEKAGASLEWIISGAGEIYVQKETTTDSPELAQVIQKTRTLWEELPLAERYEMAAVLLREIEKRRKAHKPRD